MDSKISARSDRPRADPSASLTDGDGHADLDFPAPDGESVETVTALKTVTTTAKDFARDLASYLAEDWSIISIYPADDPCTASLQRGESRMVLAASDALLIPARVTAFEPQFIHTGNEGKPAVGRAGMLYRDLIPGRLGGHYIASHITIPNGGVVDDWVHYHEVALQLIVVQSGWVRLVYEGQGEPFVLQAGDMVLQPPTIRHRVLEASKGLEVVEIGAPALHETFADHDMSLTGERAPSRSFGRQRFLRHSGRATSWQAVNGGRVQETGLWQATAGVADAQFIKPGRDSSIEFAPRPAELSFGFVLAGQAQLRRDMLHSLATSDSFVLPSTEAWAIERMSPDFRVLHVTTAPGASRLVCSSADD